MSDHGLPTVAVVGAGIAGLAAAYELAVHQGVSVVVIDSAPRVGGKVSSSELGGRPLDDGPDAFLARVPDAVDLCRELGLGDELVAPATGRAYVWRDGALRPIPEGTVLGVPYDIERARTSDVLSAAGWDRAAAEAGLGACELDGDISVGAFIRARYGEEVVAGLVGPLLGGVYAGDADELSLEATAPQLAAAARSGRSMSAALAEAAAQANGSSPVFNTIEGGLSRMVSRLVESIVEPGGAEVLVDRRVTALASSGAGWVVSTRDLDVEAHGVVLAVPAGPAASVLSEAAPEAAALLARIVYSSVVLVSLTYPTSSIGMELDGSGFLVPHSEGLTITAVSWSSSKWAHLHHDGEVTLRVSAGHRYDATAVALDDASVLEQVRADLHTTMGISPTSDPLAVRVTRYPHGLPQYEVGHLELVDRIEASLREEAPGVVVAGAAYRGLGLPACIRSGRQAARSLVEGFRR